MVDLFLLKAKNMDYNLFTVVKKLIIKSKHLYTDQYNYNKNYLIFN